MAAARKVGSAIALRVTESGVWKLGPVVRGEVIEQALGQNLPKAFPVIDKLKDGVVTSIKSVDLSATTYLNPHRLQTVLKQYVNKVAGFTEKRFDKRHIMFGRDFTKRALEVAVPSQGTPAQQRVLQQAVDYAKTKGVELNITIFP